MRPLVPCDIRETQFGLISGYCDRATILGCISGGIIVATILTVTRADNEVAAFLNGLVVYDNKTDGDPLLNDQIPLDPYLIAGMNVLVIAGINWGGPATFTGSVTVGSVVTPFNYTGLSVGMVFNQVFAIPH
jgi:hypothetical protein